MKNAMGTILPIFFVEILGNVYNKWKDPLEIIIFFKTIVPYRTIPRNSKLATCMKAVGAK